MGFHAKANAHSGKKVPASPYLSFLDDEEALGQLALSNDAIAGRVILRFQGIGDSQNFVRREVLKQWDAIGFVKIRMRGLVNQRLHILVRNKKAVLKCNLLGTY